MSDALILGLLAGALLPFSVWSWRGKTERARRWAGDAVYGEAVIIVFPPAGIICFGLFLSEIGVPYLLSISISFVGLVLAFWASLIWVLSWIWWPLHRLWGPRWYTNLSKKELLALENGDPIVDALNRISAEPSETRQPYWFGDTIEKWNGARLENIKKPVKRDAVLGVLIMGEGGVWFDAPGASVKTHRRATMSVKWADIVDARMVADNRNAVGERVRGGRSILHRLVLETTTKTYLFEITLWRARKVADAIMQEKGARCAS